MIHRCWRCSITRPFVTAVKLLQKERPGDIVFYRIGPDSEDIKFVVNYDKPLKPAFATAPEELLDFRQYSYFITKDGDFDALPDDVKNYAKVRIEGKIGHIACTVFTIENTGTEPLHGDLCSLNGNFGIDLRGYIE